MTDTEINIAIAEACGIVDVDQLGPIYKTASGWMRDCPDYCNDLNAMNEAEAWLKKDDPHAFACYASGRAEAFLRTLGKWEEVQP